MAGKIQYQMSHAVSQGATICNNHQAHRELILFKM